MRSARCYLLLSLLIVLLMAYGEALQCYTCMGSTDEDCNRQGSKTCPSYSDACAIVRGHGSGVMKSCSYKSFCSQANSQGYRAPGVKVHCCYSDDCNVAGHATRLGGGVSVLILTLLLPFAWQLL
ncbi:lymphocyte antigen 6 family member pge [Chanos chanos]|uniref:Lymphocyte antigen 6 family member pge n=1 Tax=Chanos chanos TaxID=29144 RepID=A0A6J2V961_CHACN|nr:CD59 glycoprotein-like [Chanos chanos]